MKTTTLKFTVEVDFNGAVLPRAVFDSENTIRNLRHEDLAGVLAADLKSRLCDGNFAKDVRVKTCR